MWWQMYFATVLTKYVVVMYLHRNYIRNGVESGVEWRVEWSVVVRMGVLTNNLGSITTLYFSSRIKGHPLFIFYCRIRWASQ
jgi:hypothetical protein